jgi:phenylalanyl-tRNA synthetase beta chain
VASVLSDAYPETIRNVNIPLRASRVNLIIGEQVPIDATKSILTNLGCKVSENDDRLKVSVPTYRPDLTREIDLIEEVARVYGYNNVTPTTINKIDLHQPFDPKIKFIDKIKQSAILASLSEVVTLSMIAEKNALPFVDGQAQLVRLLNPLSEEMAVLRPSLLASILPAIAYNINRKQTNSRFFEIGNTFISAREHVFEKTKIAVAITGDRHERSWQVASQEISFFDLKGILEVLFRQLGISSVNYQLLDAQSTLFAAGAQVNRNGKEIGRMGLIHPEILDIFEIEKQVFAIELDFDLLYAFSDYFDKKFNRFSSYPAVERDLAIVVEKSIAASEIVSYMERVGGKLLNKIKLFDLYTGKQVPANKRSLAFSLRFQSLQRTLKDREVDKIINTLVSGLKDKFQADLRS